MTTIQLRTLLISKLTQADMRLAKRGQGNPYRLALWMERVPDSDLAPEAFVAALRTAYLRDFSPAAFVIKAWQESQATGKVTRITARGGTRV